MPGLMFNKLIAVVVTFVACLLIAASANAEQAEKDQQTHDATSESQVISAFRSDESPLSDIVRIDDERKHLVMFAMGAPLLILIFITAGLGVAMGIYGKDVYLAHMIFAGLSLTLALAHAVVGVVWFYPF